MGKSYGFIEISGVTAAISALDIMCKTADVEFVTWERKQGGRLVTIIVQGGSGCGHTGSGDSSKQRDQKAGGLYGDCQSP